MPNFIALVPSKVSYCWMLLAHAYNPSYLECQDWESCSLRLACAKGKSLLDPISMEKKKKKVDMVFLTCHLMDDRKTK
jgi:hypothetical protein